MEAFIMVLVEVVSLIRSSKSSNDFTDFLKTIEKLTHAFVYHIELDEQCFCRCLRQFKRHCNSQIRTSSLTSILTAKK